MRNLSFMMTGPQFLDRSKDVTRRLGWLFAKPGMVVMGVEKSQGLGKGGKIKPYGPIEFVSVQREALSLMIIEPVYGRDECRREGFPGMTPEEFVEFWMKGHHIKDPATIVTRLEFKYL